MTEFRLLAEEPLPTPRSSAMATTTGGKVWVLGGTSGTRRETENGAQVAS